MKGLLAGAFMFVMLPFCGTAVGGVQSAKSGVLPEPGHQNPALNLAMGQWRFVSIGDKQVTAIGRQQPYLKFEGRTHTVTGFTGCNRLSGKYRAGDRSLSFEQVVSTQMACGEEGYEARVLEVLKSTTGYRIKKHELHLLGVKGTLAILIRPHEEQTTEQKPAER